MQYNCINNNIAHKPDNDASSSAEKESEQSGNSFGPIGFCKAS